MLEMLGSDKFVLRTFIYLFYSGDSSSRDRRVGGGTKLECSLDGVDSALSFDGDSDAELQVCSQFKDRLSNNAVLKNMFLFERSIVVDQFSIL